MIFYNMLYNTILGGAAAGAKTRRVFVQGLFHRLRRYIYIYIYIYIYTYIYIYVYIYGKSAYQGKPHVLYDMRKLLGWLETRLAQIALDHIKLA